MGRLSLTAKGEGRPISKVPRVGDRGRKKNRVWSSRKADLDKQPGNGQKDTIQPEGTVENAKVVGGGQISRIDPSRGAGLGKRVLVMKILGD